MALHWLRSWLRGTSHASPSPQRRRVPRRSPLCVEALEDRTVPAGIVVANPEVAQLGAVGGVFINVTANDLFNGQSLQGDSALLGRAVLYFLNQGDVSRSELDEGLRAPAHGIIRRSGPGGFFYQPDATFVDQDSFQYGLQISNDETPGSDSGGYARATVTITRGVGIRPVALDDSAETTVNQAVTIAVLANDSDPNQRPFSLTGTGDAAHGQVTLNPGGTVTYTPEANFVGTDSFTYVITNSDGTSASATVRLEVLDPTKPPDAITDVAVTPMDQPVVIAVLANDTIPDGSSRVASVGAPHDGTAVLNGDGTVTYTPRSGFRGTDVFDYRIGGGLVGDSAIVLVAVGLSQNEAYVASLYAYLLQREPDPAGFAHWVGVLNAAPDLQTMNEVYRAFVQGDEYLKDVVASQYKEVLGRSPDPGGEASWLEQLKKGLSPDEMRNLLLASPEYQQKHPNYVADLYKHLLNREVDAEGLKTFNDLLAKGIPARDVVDAISQSPEGRKQAIDKLYKQILRRKADESGVQSWTDRLTNAGKAVDNTKKDAKLALDASTEAVKRGLLTSDEARNLLK